MSVSLSLYIVLHFFVDLLCQINLPLEKKKKDVREEERMGERGGWKRGVR